MKIAFLLLCLFLLGCRPLINRAGFFPPRAFYFTEPSYSEDYLKEFNENWGKRLTGIFTAFQEPSLYELSNDEQSQSYRFLWVRAFDRPIVLRLIIDQRKTATLVIKVSEIDSQTGDVGRIIENRTRAISNQQVNGFQARLEAAGFWKIPGYDGKMVIDGSSWFLEGVNKGQYKIVARRSPEEDAFRQAALYLLELSDLKGEEIY